MTYVFGNLLVVVLVVVVNQNTLLRILRKPCSVEEAVDTGSLRQRSTNVLETFVIPIEPFHVVQDWFAITTPSAVEERVHAVAEFYPCI